MYLYNKYIIKKLLFPTLVILLSLSGIIWLTRLVKFFELVTEKGMGILEFFSLSSFLLPAIILIAIPISLFAATLFMINVFLNSKELFIFRDMGLSNWQFTKPFLLVAFGFMLISYFFTLFVSPYSQRSFSEKQNFIKNHYIALAMEEGVFKQPGEGSVVYIGDKDGDLMQNIFIYNQDNIDEFPDILIAKSGRVIKNNDGTRIILYEGKRYIFNEENQILSELDFENYVTDMDLNNDSMAKNNTIRPARERYMHELINVNKKDIDLKTLNKFKSEIHDRISWPLLSLLLPFIALAIMLSGEYNRVGQTRKNLISTIAVASIVMGVFIFKNLINTYPNMYGLLYGFIGLNFVGFGFVGFANIATSRRSKPLSLSGDKPAR